MNQVAPFNPISKATSFLGPNILTSVSDHEMNFH